MRIGQSGLAFLEQVNGHKKIKVLCLLSLMEMNVNDTIGWTYQSSFLIASSDFIQFINYSI